MATATVPPASKKACIDVCFFDGASPLAATLLRMRILELQPLITRFYVVEAGNVFPTLYDDPVIKEWRGIITYVPLKHYPKERMYHYVLPLIHHDHLGVDDAYVVVCHHDEIPDVKVIEGAMCGTEVKWLAMHSFVYNTKYSQTSPFTKAFVCPLASLHDVTVYREAINPRAIPCAGWRFRSFTTMPVTNIDRTLVETIVGSHTLPNNIRLLPAACLNESVK
jgi:hypothetical protein